MFNKNEHIIQFWSLLFKQKFRLDRDHRRSLLLGKFPIILDLNQDKDLQKPIDQYGIIQLLSYYLSDENENQMTAESILLFLHDLLDFAKCP